MVDHQSGTTARVRAALAKTDPSQADDPRLGPARPARRGFLGGLPPLALALALPAWAARASYPDHPIRLIVPFAPGGGNDFIGRFVAKQLSADLKQSVFVDNRAGAGGLIGVEDGVKSDPDGATLTLISLSYTVNPSLFHISFNPLADITPIGQISKGPLVAVVPASLKISTLQDFIALAKAKPNTVNYASSGVGSIIHLATAYFASAAGIKLLHVPYKGAGPAMADTLSGRIQLLMSSIPEALPLIQAGKLRALAVTTPQRSQVLPQVPTVAQAGVPGYDVTLWHGLIGPKGLSPAIVQKLNQALHRALGAPEVVKVLNSNGFLPAPSTPEQFRQEIQSGLTLWARIARQAGVKPST